MAPITSVFSVPGALGSNSAYVNPHGAVHQTITLRSVSSSVALEASLPTLTDTWFPGYAWTVLYCGCGEHLGWKFTLIPPAERGDSVTEFYGIRASALTSER
ncbi:hypothetical protein TrRE_jg4045 [Triparma retinervis]|uniref:Protein yippee-like n=1 Tax=Triparma retinervis TaxID=2557542 RepID=A0A9W7L2N4_9STRA|nr:hypothetical protein TrRE_jg4045 [Triparma retinervis]